MNAKYLHMFRYLMSAVFILWMQMFINPLNKDPLESEDGEHFFGKEIDNNCVNFILITSVLSFISLTLPLSIIRSPKRLESNISSWVRSLFKKTNFEHSMTADEIDILIKTSRASIHFEQDISKSFRESLVNDKHLFDFEKENQNATRFFYFMILFTILDYIGSTILSDNFKYVSLMLGFGDSQISVFYFFSTFVVVLSNFACAYVY